MTDEQLLDLAGKHLHYDRRVDIISFARALLSASQPAAKPLEIFHDDDMGRRGFVTGWNAALKEVAAAPAQSGEPVSNDWKAAIDNELVTIESTADSFSCAREAVKALIDWHVATALDPAVSSDAQALIDKGKQSAVVLDDERAALLADYIELNMSNYGPDDVGRLNAWAIEAYGFISRAASPQAQPERALTDWQYRCAALVDIYDDALNNAPEDRCYVDGSFEAEIDEVRALLTAARPETGESGENS